MIQMLVRSLDSQAVMVVLIDGDYPRWQGDVLCKLFSMDEMEAIKIIPVNLCRRDDVQVWYHIDNGVFSVKIAYHLYKDLAIVNGGESSSRVHIQEVWKSIWQLLVPNSIKIFIWRACEIILATLSNILRRKIVQDSLCPIL